MEVVDLADEHRDLFAICLEDWSEDAREAGPRRACWVERFLDRGLRAKLVVDDDGQIAGMIQYLPIEESWVDGEGLYMILCIWVHGHKQGRGNRQGRGMGRALLEAAEADARALGAEGMAAWGLVLPFWMKASWFRKHGYRKADRQGVAALVWKPFTADARPPRWFEQGAELPEFEPGKVNVTVFNGGWCMVGNLVAERARRAADEFGDQVAYREIDVSERAAAAEWGRIDDLFIDGKQVRTGPPPSYEKIRSIIAKRVRKL
jgi:N-acetylglutamate synthase-like GNAT family acetyltransferase